MTMHVVREHVPQTNGDPDKLIEEATEMLVVESEPTYRVNIEHFGCDSLIRIDCGSRDDAVTLINRIESTLSKGETRLRVDAGLLISLESLRQAWIEQSNGSLVAQSTAE